ncbi:hypothetical protein AB0F17_43115 [Nonomuraea sp. NPDC026600]|uniref:hypothetical protein n=1 Tax=Nonomuraea sp. NPDC026600 TaxID=3155363 RepID=UPI0033CCEF6B
MTHTPDSAREAILEVATLISALEDVQRAVTPEEQAAAGLRLEVETTFAMAGVHERNRQRLLKMIRNGIW